MRAKRLSAYVFTLVTAVAACRGSSDVRHAGEVHVSSAELIEIEPGVQVVADADEPLFFADDAYWLYRDGMWMRSDDYRGGFTRVETSGVPQRLRAIERPQTYAQYRRNMGRNIQARADHNMPPDDQRMPPDDERMPPDDQRMPPDDQGVPSTPGADTWQPQSTPRLPSPTSPTSPMSPNDAHGGAMPPHQVPPIRTPMTGEDGTIAPERTIPIEPNRPTSPPAPTGVENNQGAEESTTDRIDQATPPNP